MSALIVEWDRAPHECVLSMCAYTMVVELPSDMGAYYVCLTGCVAYRSTFLPLPRGCAWASAGRASRASVGAWLARPHPCQLSASKYNSLLTINATIRILQCHAQAYNITCKIYTLQLLLSSYDYMAVLTRIPTAANLAERKWQLKWANIIEISNKLLYIVHQSIFFTDSSRFSFTKTTWSIKPNAAFSFTGQHSKPHPRFAAVTRLSVHGVIHGAFGVIHTRHGDNGRRWSWRRRCVHLRRVVDVCRHLKLYVVAASVVFAHQRRRVVGAVLDCNKYTCFSENIPIYVYVLACLWELWYQYTRNYVRMRTMHRA